MIIRKTGWDTNIFIELTRPRETMLRFDGVRVKLTEAPERELEGLFLHYVERTFVTKKYQEQLVEEAVRKVLKTGKLNERYKKYIFGSNDTYHATFPFVYLKERAGTGNLNKPLSGESATFDCPTGRGNGAEDGKKNETDALRGVQSKSGVSGLGGRQDAGRTGTAV